MLGTTTPLYTLLMAGLGALSGGVDAPFPVIALAVNSLADALTCLLLWRMGKHLNAEAAGLAAALVWALAPYSVTFAIGGLETSVYILLLTAAALGYMLKKRFLTAFCAALALVTRPDALILVAPLALDRSVRAVWYNEKIEIKELLAFFLPTLGWSLFALLTFGSPFPHSVQAKLVAYHLAPLSSLVRLIQHYATPFLQHNYLGSTLGIGIGILLFPFLYAIGALRAWRSNRRVLAFILYPWLYFISFALPNPLIFRWYLAPPLPAYFLFILIGADQLLRSWFTRKERSPAAWRRWSPALLLVLLPLASTLTGWQLHPDHGPDRPAPNMAWFKLELLYQQAAAEFGPQMNTDTLLAAGDVGALGYFTPARILDTVGLNSPQTLRYYPLDDSYYVTNYAIPTNLILDEQPDFIIILEVYARRTFLQNARFQQQYELVKTLPTDIYTSDGMLLFRRKPPQDFEQRRPTQRTAPSRLRLRRITAPGPVRSSFAATAQLTPLRLCEYL